MIAILPGMRRNLNVVLICISLMAKNGEHFVFVFALLRTVQLIWPFIDWIIFDF
jgi:hypothetical protein